MQVDGHEPAFAIADDDMECSTEDKTSTVHFLRFELNTEMIVALKSGVGMYVGVDHPHYPCPRVSLLGDLLESLRNDFA